MIAIKFVTLSLCFFLSFYLSISLLFLLSNCLLPIALYLGMGPCDVSPIYTRMSSLVEVFRSCLGNRVVEISWTFPCSN